MKKFPFVFRKIGGLPRGAMLKVDNQVAHLYVLEAPGSIYEMSGSGERYASCPTPSKVVSLEDGSDMTLEAGTWEIERIPQ